MQASNLGVIFGPTLMRPKEETMAAIMSIKYQSIVVETMIKEYDKVSYKPGCGRELHPENCVWPYVHKSREFLAWPW